MLKTLLRLLMWVILTLSVEVKALSSSSYLLANSAINLFDFELAYSYYKSLDKEIELSEVGLNNKLIASINLGLFSEANDVAKKILTQDSLNQEAWIAYLAFSKINNDRMAFNKYKKISYKDEMVLTNYIFSNKGIEIKSNKIIARKIFDIVKASEPDKSNDHKNYNFLLFYLSMACLLDPNFNEAFFYSAQIYQNLKIYEKAEIFYNKINTNHPLYLEGYKNIIFNKGKQNSFIQREQSLLNLKNNYLNKNKINLILADFYRIEKKYEQAIFYYSKLIDSNKNLHIDLWRVLYLRGICYEKILKWNIAENDFLKSLNINPNSPQVLNYLAYGWLERGIYLDKAVKFLVTAYKTNPSNYHILDSLAWGYYKKNELNKAAKLMEKVISLAPGEAVSLDHLGDIYYAMKRKREALYLWKQAFDLTDSDDVLLESLKKKINQNNDG
jgi:tetratricopeptide (TPR) repeat protein